MVIFKAGFKTDKGQGTRQGSKIICSSSEHSQGAHTKIYITLFCEPYVTQWGEICLTEHSYIHQSYSYIFV